MTEIRSFDRASLGPGWTVVVRTFGVCFLVGAVLAPAALDALQVVESLEHDPVRGLQPALIQIDADTYAVAYLGGEGDRGWLKTFDISADGRGIAAVQAIEHDESGSNNSLVRVDADTFALAYAGEGLDGFLKTFDISADGTNIEQIHFIEHDTVRALGNSLLRLSGNLFALAYTDFLGSHLKTFLISDDGQEIEQIHSLEHDQRDGGGNSLVRVDLDTVALAYSGGGFTGLLKTFDISADGRSISEVRAIEIDPQFGIPHSLIRTGAETFAMAYTGRGSDGVLKTFNISADGRAIVELQQLVHESVLASGGALLQAHGEIYLLAYRGLMVRGILKTFEIPGDGLSITELEVLDPHSVTALSPSLARISADTFAVAYSGEGDDGFVQTFTVPVVSPLEIPTTGQLGGWLLALSVAASALRRLGAGQG